MKKWNTKAAKETYSLDSWGSGYFDVNDSGHLTVYPDAEAVRKQAGQTSIDLYTLSDLVREKGLSLPVLVRFKGILRHRVDELYQAFGSAIAASNYQGTYTAVYPIKVNQQHSVVGALLDHPAHHIGLEAGSKPELLAVLAMVDQDQGLIVCNGYKDREYVRLALIGKALGHRIYIVIEKLSELDRVIEESRKLDIEPMIGVRMRMASVGGGQWQNTGGEKSKFGLSATKVISVLERLRDEGMMKSLGMMHFHMGSQIASIEDIKTGMSEASHYYAELSRQGANIQFINVGGGLGVDYTGTRSSHYFSSNYSVEEYAACIVQVLDKVCSENNLPRPDIVTESGRALTAHHAVLITNVIDVEQAPLANEALDISENEISCNEKMLQLLQQLKPESAIASFYETKDLISEVQQLFNEGSIKLDDRARAEKIYYTICHNVRASLNSEVSAHQTVLDEINQKLADKYFCNFSLFQSLPDVWAIDQIFPIVPLHRLNERPDRRGVLVDITCDSDGRIDHYVDMQGTESSLPLHRTKAGEPYLLGIFLVGAYQEILGDMHNLFGDTDSVDVDLEQGQTVLSQVLRGDDVGSVLRYVHFDPEELLASYKRKIKNAKALSPSQCESYINELAEGLEGYTYLED